jgi:hypothetical protein
VSNVRDARDRVSEAEVLDGPLRDFLRAQIGVVDQQVVRAPDELVLGIEAVLLVQLSEVSV